MSAFKPGSNWNRRLCGVCHAQDELPQHIRVQTIEYIASLTKEVGLQCETVFTTVTLLDLALLRMGVAVAETQLPQLSSAMACMSKKMESVGCRIRSRELVQKARDFAIQLRSQGDMNNTIDIAMGDVGNAERMLAATLQWQFSIPSIQQWLKLYVSRVSVIYPRTRDDLDWVYKTGIHVAKKIVFKHMMYKEAFPQQVAQGLFSTGLVLAGIVPVETLCPAGMDQDAWKAKWQNEEVWPGMTVASNATFLVPAAIGRPFLELATHTSIEVLQNATVRSILLIWA